MYIMTNDPQHLQTMTSQMRTTMMNNNQMMGPMMNTMMNDPELRQQMMDMMMQHQPMMQTIQGNGTMDGYDDGRFNESWNDGHDE